MGFGSELRTYFNVIWRRKWVVVAAFVLGVVLAAALNLLLIPEYASTTTLRVSSAPAAAVDDLLVRDSLASRLMNTYVEISTSRPVLSELSAFLGPIPKPTIKAEIIPGTELIEVTVWHPNPAVARDAAAFLAQLMVDRSLELYTGGAPKAREILDGQIAQAKQDLDNSVADYEAALASTATDAQLEILSKSLALRQDIYSDLLQQYETTRQREEFRSNSISILEPAELQIRPDKPNIPLNTALVLLGTLAAGIMGAFVLENLDPNFRSIEEVESVTSLSVVGEIPRLKKRAFARIRSRNSSTNGRRKELEAYHQLRETILRSVTAVSGKSILLTSAEAGAGKTVVIANLGLSLAKSGERVLLIDADLRRGRLHKLLALEAAPGISEVLAGSSTVGQSIAHTWVGPNLRLLPRGRPISDPSSLLTPEKFASVLDEVEHEYDHVLIDTPPALAVADASVIASRVDSILFVVSLHRTRRADLVHVLRQWHGFRYKLAGVVVNRVPRSGRYYGFPWANSVDASEQWDATNQLARETRERSG